jgi:hypothetical protein
MEGAKVPWPTFAGTKNLRRLQIDESTEMEPAMECGLLPHRFAQT